MSTPPPIEEQLSQLFAHSAESLREQLFELFTKPTYFPELTTSRACVLFGGRGTGKTTVLRGLSYEGHFALSNCDRNAVADWPYYGIYHRINTNRVAAFAGPEMDTDQWVKYFGHYCNLILCDSVVSFLDWFQLQTGRAVVLQPEACARIATSLHLGPVSSLRDFGDALRRSRVDFEACINNIADRPAIGLSLQGAPLDELFGALAALPLFRGKRFFFLLDEYENLSDYQQQVVNTLFKHASELYTFKIGVRDLGWRQRTTLNSTEQLNSPADYVRIDIAERFDPDTFRAFAKDVCNERLARLQLGDQPALRDVTSLLASLTAAEEADLLGVAEHSARILAELETLLSPDEFEELRLQHALRIYFLEYWSTAQNEPLDTVARDFLSGRSADWETRFGNYKHVLLYTLRRRKRGIQKYYCGFSTFSHLAGANIRYLLELVDQSLMQHVREGNALSAPVSPKVQTEAAQRVGRKNLAEVGLSKHGAQLTKLLLGLGRVFGVMARDPIGHAPEINQFQLSDDSVDPAVDELLTAAVMYLALVRQPGNKLADHTDTKDYDYSIHPIFSPFFVFSYRRKRKLALSSTDVLGFIERPRETIRDILARNNRSIADDLPEQLTLFEKYYHAGT